MAVCSTADALAEVGTPGPVGGGEGLWAGLQPPLYSLPPAGPTLVQNLPSAVQSLCESWNNVHTNEFPNIGSWVSLGYLSPHLWRQSPESLDWLPALSWIQRPVLDFRALRGLCCPHHPSQPRSFSSATWGQYCLPCGGLLAQKAHANAYGHKGQPHGADLVSLSSSGAEPSPPILTTACLLPCSAMPLQTTRSRRRATSA